MHARASVLPEPFSNACCGAVILYTVATPPRCFARLVCAVTGLFSELHAVTKAQHKYTASYTVACNKLQLSSLIDVQDRVRCAALSMVGIWVLLCRV